jgi:hypothetical protein
LSYVLPMLEGQPVTPLGRALVNARERVQARGIDELKAGEIDDERGCAERPFIELGLEHRPCATVKRAAEPYDERLPPAPRANHELPRRRGFTFVGTRAADAPETIAAALQISERERCSRRAERLAVPERCGLRPCAVCVCTALQVHAAPAVGSVSKTVTEVWSDTNSGVTGVSGHAISGRMTLTRRK